MLFLVALFVGVAVPTFAVPRLGLATHLLGITQGIFLMVLGLVWPRLAVSQRRLASREVARDLRLPRPLDGESAGGPLQENVIRAMQSIKNSDDTAKSGTPKAPGGTLGSVSNGGP